MAQMKTTAPKMFCFVLMPFDPEFKDVYEIGIKEACESAGAYCQRVDEQIFHASILDQIYNQISKADVVIADMTGRNPNVFYEVGYAHALGKRTILLTKSAADIPFDLKHYPHIVYEGSITKLRDQLKARVEWCIENPIETAKAHTIDIELYIGEVNLSSEMYAFDQERNAQFLYRCVTVHNNSPRTYISGECGIGVILGEKLSMRRKEWSSTPLPNGDNLLTLSRLSTLFPGQYCKFILSMSRKNLSESKIVLRVFTNAGSREWALTWPCEMAN